MTHRASSRRIQPVTVVAAIAALLLTAAWSLTSTALPTRPTADSVAAVTAAAAGMAVLPSCVDREHVEHRTSSATVSPAVNSARHPRRAVPPDRKPELQSQFVSAPLLEARAGAARIRPPCEEPRASESPQPVESRAPPSGPVSTA